MHDAWAGTGHELRSTLLPVLRGASVTEAKQALETHGRSSSHEVLHAGLACMAYCMHARARCVHQAPATRCFIHTRAPSQPPTVPPSCAAQRMHACRNSRGAAIPLPHCEACEHRDPAPARHPWMPCKHDSAGPAPCTAPPRGARRASVTPPVLPVWRTSACARRGAWLHLAGPRRLRAWPPRRRASAPRPGPACGRGRRALLQLGRRGRVVPRLVQPAEPLGGHQVGVVLYARGEGHHSLLHRLAICVLVLPPAQRVQECSAAVLLWSGDCLPAPPVDATAARVCC